METQNQLFFKATKFAVVGNSGEKPFPKLTFNKLNNSGKKAYPIDSSVPDIDGYATFNSFADLPEKVERAILELPKVETIDWLKKADEAGIKDIWIHMGRETPEAIQYASDHNINLRTGTCAVMYLTQGVTYHSLHKWISKLTGKF
jgi:uncharacterized protein